MLLIQGRESDPTRAHPKAHGTAKGKIYFSEEGLPQAIWTRPRSTKTSRELGQISQRISSSSREWVWQVRIREATLPRTRMRRPVVEGISLVISGRPRLRR